MVLQVSREQRVWKMNCQNVYRLNGHCFVLHKKPVCSEVWNEWHLVSSIVCIVSKDSGFDYFRRSLYNVIVFSLHLSWNWWNCSIRNRPKSSTCFGICFKQRFLKNWRVHCIVFSSNDEIIDSFSWQNLVAICQKAFRSFLYEIRLSFNSNLSARIRVRLDFKKESDEERFSEAKNIRFPILFCFVLQTHPA